VPYIGSLFLLSVLFFFQGIAQGLTDLSKWLVISTLVERKNVESKKCRK
jgi:hypothetical protein